MLIEDWKKAWKKWSVQLTTLMVTAQVTWAAVPSEARELMPSPEYIGIGLGIAALFATILKQGSEDGTEQ